MIFENLEDFFWMEGLGPFVLGAYFITFVVLGINLFFPMIRECSAGLGVLGAQCELKKEP